MGDPLRIERLTIQAGPRILVSDVDLELHRGELLGVVGASGSGKSLTARAMLGLVPAELTLHGRLTVPTPEGLVCPYEEVGRAREHNFRALRGRSVGLLVQDAGHSLDPFRTVGAQVARAGGRRHEPAAVRQALLQAGFRDPDAVLGHHPHHLSGGMAQRVALACLLIVGCTHLLCDEPTTGLDAAVQRSLMGTLVALARDGHGVMVVSHALRWLHDGADRVVVFEDGRVVEHASGGADLTSPAGRRLLDAVRRSSSAGFPAALPSPGEGP